MVYDNEKSEKNLREAIETFLKCDPDDCDCEKCPIGQPMEFVANDYGVKIVADVCGMLCNLQDICYNPELHRYQNG